MKKTFLLFILVGLISSCNKDDNEENSMGNPFKFDIELPGELRNQVTKIVPIAHFKDGSKFVIGTSYKTQDGVELHLQNPLNPKLLYPLKEYADFIHGEIDNGVMCYGAVSLYAYNENKFIGTLKKSYYYDDSENRNELSSFLCLMYVTGDATVSGSRIIDGKPFKTYNVNLKRGWNLYICVQTIHYTVEGAHDYTSLEFTSEIPDNLVWQFMK
ncbi:hypothetical protein [uncultured Bacteroides sp.]|uniref:hypothetical protein n=1 Tax=uncultured Bacteroides sp. TaxID=162156 RepID=UPI0025F67B9B|nr:hypothetical protein [uncultured Bacteroides sp.]